MDQIKTIEDLENLYGPAVPGAIKKETGFLTPEYKKWVKKASFFAIASIGPDGLDCSPRGDPVGALLTVLNDKQLLIPDRRGNNRLDTLKNIVFDPRISLLFLIPGINETLRIKGRATVSTNPELIELFDVGGKTPKSVICVEIEAVYFQCARALKRAGLWETDDFVQKQDVPTAGQMAQSAIPGFDGQTYDEELQARQKKTLY